MAGLTFNEQFSQSRQDIGVIELGQVAGHGDYQTVLGEHPQLSRAANRAAAVANPFVSFGINYWTGQPFVDT